MLYRAQVVLKHVSGIPADDIVNTWHVKTIVGASVGDAEDIAEAIRDFYVADTGPQTEPLMEKLGPQVADTGHEVRMYDIVEATGLSNRYPGAPPLHVEGFDFLGRSDPPNGAPSEVAVCLSMRNNTELTVPAARRRGRIYFGPLKTTGVIAIGADLTPRPNVVLTGDLRAAAVVLKTTLSGMPAEVGIYSRPYAGRDELERPGRPTLPALPARPGVFYEADQFWTDDAFDTQRRRGEAASTRTFS